MRGVPIRLFSLKPEQGTGERVCLGCTKMKEGTARGKRDGATTEDFIFDLRERVIGNSELSSDAWKPYQPAIRAAFGDRAIYGQIAKTYSVVDLRRSAAYRYSPAEVVAVSRDVVSGVPGHISTSYVERQHLSLRMSQRRFARLTNAFSKKAESHIASVGLYVAHYNFCRVHETIKMTPAMALGLTDHAWSIGELLDRALSLTRARRSHASRSCV